jgi:hypothetical protein
MRRREVKGAPFGDRDLRSEGSLHRCKAARTGAVYSAVPAPNNIGATIPKTTVIQK